MIVIIDYGLGNLGSMANMFRKIQIQAKVTSNPTAIRDAHKLILPGVGSFDQGMKNLLSLDLFHVLNKRVIEDRVPILGICLGMQLLGKRSEEGNFPGFGWLDAETVRFNFHTSRNLKIPHMGWNQITVRKFHPLVSKLEDVNRFYFVHSYYVVCLNPDIELATTSYGINFTSAVIQDNIMGVQFHPEKSHKFGMQMLKNFADMV